ncbi:MULTISPECIES: hypothetical protein [Nocardioides]|uniref:hypothetical protein n=1 Tax=Nocardioides TaxID=1839 RepID=UPI00032EA040|nr:MULTISPECIES: hypothetical protein [Nocardioides]EON22095.1 hypothetical protein CF8_4028 [Nocardioides sp. CF8]
MRLPQIDATDDQIGFRWLSSEGSVLPLREVIALPGAEPDRWLPTHLEALDDVLIEVAGTYGEVLGGGRRPTTTERDALVEVYATLDRLCWEYADAHAATELPGSVRAGQIIGTAALMSIRTREAISMMGAPPFAGDLDEPGLGVIGGRAGLHWVTPETAWPGARWLVVTDDGLRLPATLTMLLFDASGVDKDATLTEHREALIQVTDAVTDPAAEPMQASGALDWLLFDWIMAHRDGPDSGAVEIRSGKVADADMIVAAAAASAHIRARFDPALVGSLA